MVYPDSIYDIKKAYDEHGLEGLREKTRRKPCHKNRVAPEVEEAVLKLAYEYPAYGQLRVSNELRKEGILVSGGGVRSIWQRHNLETFKKRLAALEEKAAKEGIVYTEAQLAALEAAKREPRRFTEDDFFKDDVDQYEEYESDIRQFELTGSLFYPLEKGIVFNFRTSYLTGSTNDRSRTTYYYEGVITYPVSRRFGILTLWRQTWTQIEGYPDREESRAELKADYRLGRTYLSFEAWLRRIEDEGERYDRLIYFRVRRTF